jgi:hypothetical protein
MTAIITNKHRILSAELIKEAYDSSDTTKNRYLFIGKSLPWDDETIPDAPADALQEENEHWIDMIALKKIIETDCVNALPRQNWVSDTYVYAEYKTTDGDLFNRPTSTDLSNGVSNGYSAGRFYAVTSDLNVYLCISNGGSTPASPNKSVNEPTGNSTSIFETADGYRWKYVFTIKPSDAEKFLSPDWIPVRTLTSDDGSFQWDVQSAATNGELYHIDVTNGGSGYTDVASGGVVSATSTTIVLGGSASSSDDVYNGASIYISGSTGGGQVRVITDYVGSTKTATVAAWGTNPDSSDTYEILPTISISGNGTGAVAKATVSGGEITEIALTDVGSGYNVASVSISGSGGTGATATIRVSPEGGLGADAVRQMGASFLMINTSLDNDETDFPPANDYRKIGMIANVYDYGTTDIATASTLSAVSGVTLGSVSGTFEEDEIITGGTSGSTAKVVYDNISSGSGTVYFVQNLDTGFGAFQTSEAITGSSSSASGTCSALVDPEVEPFSGEIFFIDQRRAVTRDDEQNENITLILEF